MHLSNPSSFALSVSHEAAKKVQSVWSLVTVGIEMDHAETL